MAKAKRYSMEQIQAAQKMLRALSAKKSGKSKKEVVELLAEDVRKAVKEGNSLKAIQETLRQSDIPVSLARMKTLLGETETSGLQNEHGGSQKKDSSALDLRKARSSPNANATRPSGRTPPAAEQDTASLYNNDTQPGAA